MELARAFDALHSPWLPGKDPAPFLSSDSGFIPVTGKAGGGINCLFKAIFFSFLNQAESQR